MGSFSQRYGYSLVEETFQREFISAELRTQLWNVLSITVWEKHESRVGFVGKEQINQLVKRIWFDHLNKDMDCLPQFRSPKFGNPRNSAYGQLKQYFFDCLWFQVYDFMEFIAKDTSRILGADSRAIINSTLQKFNAAYRFVGAAIIEITDKNEIEAIENALNHPNKPVRDHLTSALNKLSDKETPDYRNSIKESISAVEAACRILTGNKSATLGDALKKIDNLHPSMGKAFDKLYGYTSDASGVRHSLIDEPTITYADAKFMLVTCSAFVSYLNTNLSKS